MKEDRKHVLFLGTFPPPVTGQSAAFEMVYNSYTGIKYRVNKAPAAMYMWQRVLRQLLVLPQVVYILATKRVDVIYATTFSTIGGSLSDLLLFAVNMFFRKPVIVHLHGSSYKDSILSAPALYRKILLFFLSEIDQAVVLTEGMKEQFYFLPPGRIRVIPNFYDPLLDRNVVREPTGSGPVLKVGYLSNLIYSKGVFHLVEAVRQLVGDGFEVELHMAGKCMGDAFMTGSEVEKRLAREQSEADCIHYYGVVRGEEKVNFLSGIQVFALPTFYEFEAQPLSIIEAMRAGCYVISTNYKYIPELVSGRNGSLIPPGDKEAIYNEIKRCILDREMVRRIGNDNSVFSREKYSPHAYIEQVNDLLRNVNRLSA